MRLKFEGIFRMCIRVFLITLIMGVFAPGLALCEQDDDLPDMGSQSDETRLQSEIETLLLDYETHWRAYDPLQDARLKGEYPSGWPDIRLPSRKKEAEEAKALSKRIAGLGGAATLDIQIMDAILTSKIARLAHDPDRIPFTGDSGFYSLPGFVLRSARITDREDADTLLYLIAAIPAYIEANIQNMRRGLAQDYMAHRDPVATTLAQLQAITVQPPEQSAFFIPFATLPDAFSPELAADYQEKARAHIEEALAAYRILSLFMQETYAPSARQKAGLGHLPGGAEAYQAALVHHTTRPDLTPEAVHKTGLKEVARIRAEMEGVIADTGFEGSFADFLHFLRSDPQFYADSPEALLAEAAVLSKQLDASLPRFFRKLPRLPYGVLPVPDEIAPGYTTARYMGGDIEKGQAGTYLVNTYRLDQRPLYELPALSAHEAVPGHHLQIALAQELETVPDFRRSYYATAFGEGWALYAERLAGEAGLYDTPYKRFGALSYEMWRACRLVADTGLHRYDWDREEAEACFRDNTALAPHNITTEVTRYIGWPGQALGYKIGEITIRELRREAETALGDTFDIRAFHDALLAEGAMPLSLMETRMRDWIGHAQSDAEME